MDPRKFRESSAQLGTALSSPITVELEVTYGCNNLCQFCYNVWKKDEYPKPQEADMLFVLDRLIEADVKMLFLTGGEPFLRKDLFVLLEHAVDNGMKTSVVTNGVLLTEETAQQLKALKTAAQVSLHGSQKIHDYLVGVPGAYERTRRGLQHLQEAHVPTNINITLTRHNFSELPHVGGIARSMRAGLSMTRLVLTGKGVNKSLQFTRETISELMDFLTAQHDLKGASIQSPFPLCCLGEEGFSKMGNLYEMYDVVGCQGGITWCAVSPEGKVRICGAMEREEGDLTREDLRTVWKTAEAIQMCRTLSHLPQKCCECEYLSVCTGGCRADAYALSGRVDAPDPLAAR